MHTHDENWRAAAALERPWSYEVACVKARELAMKLNIAIYIVATDGAFDQKTWNISKQSREEREAYAVARDEELRKLHPDRYTPPLTELEKIAAEKKAWSDEQDTEIRRLWEHDNPGLRELYYPAGFPRIFFPNCD